MSYQRSVIVTGGTANLGYHTALKIARAHPEWLVVISSPSDGNNAASSINKATGRSNTIFLPIDLGNLKSVRAYVDEWASKNRPPIEALLLNAGLQFPAELKKNSDGLELTFAINHVGHALLFHLLCPYLAPKARVVLTSSGTHDPAQKTGVPDAIYNSAQDLAYPPPSTHNDPGRKRYSSTKLASTMWTYALHRRLAERARDRGITITAMDPGLMPGTGLAREAGPVIKFMWYKIMPHIIPLMRVLVSPNIHTASESADGLARLAIGGDVAGVSGKYYEGLKEIKSSVDSYDERKQEDIWQWTISYLAKDDTEAARFEALA